MSRGERGRDGFTFGGAAALWYICYPVFEPWTFTCCYGVQSGCGPSAPRAVLTISGGNVGDVLQGNCITAVKVWFDGASRNNGSADAATEAGFGVFAVDARWGASSLKDVDTWGRCLITTSRSSPRSLLHANG